MQPEVRECFAASVLPTPMTRTRQRIVAPSVSAASGKAFATPWACMLHNELLKFQRSEDERNDIHCARVHDGLTGFPDFHSRSQDFIKVAPQFCR